MENETEDTYTCDDMEREFVRGEAAGFELACKVLESLRTKKRRMRIVGNKLSSLIEKMRAGNG